MPQSLAPERPSAPTSSTGSFNSHSPTLSTFLLRYLYISDENVLDSIGTGIQHEYNGVGGVDDVRPFCGFRESFGQTLVFSFSAYSHTILPWNFWVQPGVENPKKPHILRLSCGAHSNRRDSINDPKHIYTSDVPIQLLLDSLLSEKHLHGAISVIVLRIASLLHAEDT